MTAHPAAAQQQGMERLIEQRKAAHLLTIREDLRGEEKNTLDTMEILPLLEKLGIVFI